MNVNKAKKMATFHLVQLKLQQFQAFLSSIDYFYRLTRDIDVVSLFGVTLGVRCFCFCVMAANDIENAYTPVSGVSELPSSSGESLYAAHALP